VNITDNKEYQAVQEKKWELNRLVDALNEQSPHLAACAVWSIADTLLITLCCERASTNAHLQALRKFLHEEWPS
jgi:hypothetical protein